MLAVGFSRSVMPKHTAHRTGRAPSRLSLIAHRDEWKLCADRVRSVTKCILGRRHMTGLLRSLNVNLGWRYADRGTTRPHRDLRMRLVDRTRNCDYCRTERHGIQIALSICNLRACQGHL